MAVADLNGDTHPDLAVANALSDNVSVLLGDGAGSFGPATNYTADIAPNSVSVGDFDGDTHPDLVTANVATDDVLALIVR